MKDEKKAENWTGTSPVALLLPMTLVITNAFSMQYAKHFDVGIFDLFISSHSSPSSISCSMFCSPFQLRYKICIGMRSKSDQKKKRYLYLEAFINEICMFLRLFSRWKFMHLLNIQYYFVFDGRKWILQIMLEQTCGKSILISTMAECGSVILNSNFEP